MDGAGKDAAEVRIPPPLLYLAGVVAGVLLDAFVMAWPMTLSPSERIAAAGITGAAGVVLVAAAVASFRRSGQDPRPWMATPAIVSSGVFKRTRNPMYLGMALIQAAVGLALANGWILVLTPLVMAAVYFLVIRHEEVYLERKFPDEYTRYKASVRRWL